MKCVRWTVDKKYSHLTPSKNTNELYTPVMVYLRRFLSQIAEMRMNVALSDPDTMSLDLIESQTMQICVKTLKRTKCKNYSFLFVRTNTNFTKLDTLDWNLNYSQLKTRK